MPRRDVLGRGSLVAGMVALARRIFAPIERMTVREWAERYRRWPDGSLYETATTPHIRELLDAYSDPAIEEMTVMKPSQSGATEGLILNAIGYHMHRDPQAILTVLPSVDEAEKWSKKKLQPMVDDTPELRGGLEDGSRKPSNTMLEKALPMGGWLGIVGSNSARGFRMVTVGRVFGDDVDGWDRTAGSGAANEGDQVTLIRRRADRVPDRKLCWISTPTYVKGRIHGLYRSMERRGRLHVPCPHCGAMQVLKLGGKDTPYGIKWETVEVGDDYVLAPGEIRHGSTVHRPATAYYVCEKGGCVIEEDSKAAMADAGVYLADDGQPVRIPGVRTVGYWFNALTITMPGSEWPRLVQEFLSAKSDPDSYRAFRNLVEAEPWEDRHAEVDPSALQSRMETCPAGQVPDGVGVLTAFCDVQGNRLEVQVVGWGIREESWAIAHHRIYGDPEGGLGVWQALESLRTRAWKTQAGGTMHISVLGIDEGYLLPRVHDFVRGKEMAGVYAFDGQGGHREYVLRRLKKPNRRGIRPWKVAVDRFKDVYFRRLQIQRPGPGYMHFVSPSNFPATGTDIAVATGFDADYFEQLVSEEVHWSRTGGGMHRAYRKRNPRAANEGLDLWVGCMAALHTVPGISERLPEMVAKARAEKAEAVSAGPRRRKLRMAPRSNGF